MKALDILIIIRPKLIVDGASDSASASAYARLYDYEHIRKVTSFAIYI